MESKLYKIFENNGIGSAYVSEDAVIAAVGLSATEVEGVDSITGGITHDQALRAGRKKMSSGIGITCEDNQIRIFLSLVIRMGYSIPEVSEKVQSRVKAAVETMTGMTVSDVDLKIANVKLEQ